MILRGPAVGGWVAQPAVAAELPCIRRWRCCSAPWPALRPPRRGWVLGPSWSCPSWGPAGGGHTCLTSWSTGARLALGGSRLGGGGREPGPHRGLARAKLAQPRIRSCEWTLSTDDDQRISVICLPLTYMKIPIREGYSGVSFTGAHRNSAPAPSPSFSVLTAGGGDVDVLQPLPPKVSWKPSWPQLDAQSSCPSGVYRTTRPPSHRADQT